MNAKPVYWWHGREELIRLTIVALLAYVVQIAPSVVDDVGNAADPTKAVISLVVAGLQFMIARALAYLS